MGLFRKTVSTDPVHRDTGLLLLRLGIAFTMLTFHGYGKITAGIDRWAGIGAAMENFGITFAPAFWGFMAAFSEFFCSILLALGVLFRPAALLLAATMFVAVVRHLNLPIDNPASGLKGGGHALELLIVYVSLVFTGPGRFAFRLMRAPKRNS